MSSVKCIKEKEFGIVFTKIGNIETNIHDIKHNDIKHINDKMDVIISKMNNRRPTWTTATLITILTTLCGILLSNLFWAVRSMR